MNILALLTQDHRNVEELFRRFERVEPGEVDEAAHLRDKILEHLSQHAVVEEQVFYPALRRADEGLEAAILEALEEHHAAKLTLAELEKLPPIAERFRAKMQVLISSVREHVEEEEGELFEQARKALKTTELEDLGEAAEKAKAAAPTRPHPWLPDQPPFNIVVAPLVVLDKVVTGLRKTVERTLLNRAS